MPNSSNELFQSAVNGITILNTALSLIGVACIFMGYRLLARAGRRGPGIVFALFGMAMIAVAIFRTMPGPRGEKAVTQGTVPPEISQPAAPIPQRSAWPSGSTMPDEQITKVRDAATPQVHSSDGGVIPAIPGEPARLRGSGVQTKGAYVPFAKTRVLATNQSQTLGGLPVSNENGRQGSAAQSNHAGLSQDATNKPPIRAPFSVRMRVSAP